jgi:hypothetical protein
MGILVAEAVLPTSNVTVSNVYMSFSGASVTVFRDPMSPGYKISSTYFVYSSPDKQSGTNITESLVVPYPNLEQGVYSVLYAALKIQYPGAEDIIEVPLPPPSFTLSPDQSSHGRTILDAVSLYMSDNPGNTELETAYQAVEDVFGVTGPATAELEALEIIYNKLI